MQKRERDAKGTMKTALISRSAEAVSVVLVVLALVLIQLLIGGTRLLFSLPAYGLLGLAGLITLVSLHRSKSSPDQLCLASTALFLGYLVARALSSPDEYLARTDLYCAVGCVLVYFLVACIFTGAKLRMLILVVLFALAMVHVIIGAIQFTEGNNFMLIPFLQRTDYGRRASGFYVCPNHLAGMLEILGIFAVSIVCWSRWPTWGKLLAGYAAGVCYLGVVLSGSRAGYLSTIISCLVVGTLSLIILVRASAKVFLRVGGALIVAGIVIGAAIFFSVHQSDYLSSRADNVLGQNLQDPSSELRMALWRAAIQQWALRPVVGTGSGTYLYYGRQFRADWVQGGDPSHAHNDYVQMLAEYGLVAAAGFLLFLAIHLRRGWKTFSRLGPKRIAGSIAPSFLSNGLALNIGALGAVSASIVHSIVDFSLHIPANALMVAFVFGVLANAGIQRDAERRQASSFNGWSMVLPVLGVITIIQAARLLPGEYFAERARMAVRDGQYAGAALFALKGLEHEANNPHTYSYLSQALVNVAATFDDRSTQRDCLEVAVSELQDARKLAPLDEGFARQLGFVYDALGRFDEGELAYQQAVTLDPRSNFVKKDYAAHLERWRTGDDGLKPMRREMDRTAP